MTSRKLKRGSVQVQPLLLEQINDERGSGSETDGSDEQRKKPTDLLKARNSPGMEELPCCSSSVQTVIPKIPPTPPCTKDHKMLKKQTGFGNVVVALTCEEEWMVEAAMKECKHEQILRRCHDEAQKRYNKLEEGQKERAWKSLLANTPKNNKDKKKEKETLGEWSGVWSFPKERVERVANNRKPRKPLPQIEEPAAADECLFTVTEWNGKKKGETSIPSIPAPEHMLNPRMMHWTETPMNIRVEDGEHLAYYPYLDGEVDVDFENELFELYGSKDFKTARKESMPDRVFLETINDYEKSLVAQIKKTLMTRDLRTKAFAKIERQGVLMPARTIFSSMVSAFPYLGIPLELENRYAELCLGESVVKKAKKAPECGDAANTNDKRIGSDQALTIYNKLFCPRCLMYGCLTHGEDDNVDSKYLSNDGKDKVEPEITCGHEDCIQKHGKIVNGENYVEDKWSRAEIRMCKLLYRTGNHSECFISSILKTKTCRQVLKLVESQEGARPFLEAKKAEATDKAHDSMNTSSKDVADKYIPTAGPIDSGDIPYKPCSHADNAICNEKNGCCCADARTYCERWCNCTLDCPRRFKGCTCKSTCSTKACPCLKAHRECDPRICSTCGSENLVLVEGKCENVGLYHHREKKVEVKQSIVSGWGAFIVKKVKKGEFIAEFRGELLSNTESERRALCYHKIGHTFLFRLNESVVIDGTRIGSNVRFMNSSKSPNCYPQVMMVEGDHRIGLYANKNLKEGAELFLDYEDLITKT